MRQKTPLGKNEVPEIEIRPATASDIADLIALDHHYTTDHVWQMDLSRDRETGTIETTLREVRLPRSVRVDYPRPPAALNSGWARLDGLLTASLAGHPIGYVGLALGRLPHTAWITDLVVEKEVRRKGIGTGLLLAALDWAAAAECSGLMLEMQLKNVPMIRMAEKLGFDFCGYNEIHYGNLGAGLFFFKSF